MRAIILAASLATLALTACDDSLPSNCTETAAQNAIRSAYQQYYKVEAQTPAMQMGGSGDFIGNLFGNFQAGAKERAIRIAAMSSNEIAVEGARQVGSGDAVPEIGVRRYRVCEATVTVALPGGRERVRVAILEMKSGGTLQTRIEFF
jgi:hypothetical protein